MCKDPLIIVISGPNKVAKNALIICVLFNRVSHHDWTSKVKDGGLPFWVNDHTLYFHRRGRGGIAIAASVFFLASSSTIFLCLAFRLGWYSRKKGRPGKMREKKYDGWFKSGEAIG